MWEFVVKFSEGVVVVIKPGTYACLMDLGKYCKSVGGRIDDKSGDVISEDGRVLWDGKETGVCTVARSLQNDYLCYVHALNDPMATIYLVVAAGFVKLEEEHYVPIDALYYPDDRGNTV